MTTNIKAATSTSGAQIDPAAGDGIVNIYTGATAGAQVLAASFAADGTPTFLKVPANTAVQSMVRVNTANGYGSTNTKINRFTTTVTNQGSDITYADSATLGASFTINTNGVYAMTHQRLASGACDTGISLNTTEPTVSIQSLTNAAERVAIVSMTTTGYAASCSTVLYLTAGSVIRPHCDATTDGAVPNRSQFTITRVA